MICLSSGTGIATMQGEVPAERLRKGDIVFTRDNGPQPVIWAGQRTLSLGAGTLSQSLQPILIRKGALGFGLPDRDILVSPAHRVLLTQKAAQLLFAEAEVLVAARHLAGLPGIEHWIAAEVTYAHAVCDGHQIVLSNGAWTETFHPDDHLAGGPGQDQYDEVCRVFPELRPPEEERPVPVARPVTGRFEAELLAAG